MICPRCTVAEISPLTGVCELCGYSTAAASAVAVDHPDVTDELARRDLAHEFRFDAVLGQGNHSMVYLARPVADDGHVVLKVITREPGHPEADERFRAAMTRLMALDHPHLIQLLRFGVTDSLFWYSTEHARSRSLRDLLRITPTLEPRATLRLAAQIASMLEHAHRRGVVHGALKPENVMVDAEGWARVCDPSVGLALARTTDPDQSMPQGDQKALAALVHECLTGKPPADGVTPVNLPPAAAHLAPALRRAMHPNAMSRFPSVLDFVAAMETGVNPLLSSVPSVTSDRNSIPRLATIPDWKPPPREAPLRPLFIIVGTIVGLAVLFLAGPRLYRAIRGDRWETMPAPMVSSPRRSPMLDSAAAGAARDSTPSAPSRPAIRRNRPRTRDDAAPAPAAGPSPAPRAVAPAPAPAAPQPPASGETGRLFVNAAPWGAVYLDGQLIGNTPRANIAVSAGSHVLRVVRDGYEPYERTIRVGAGEVVRVTDIVLVERP